MCVYSVGVGVGSGAPGGPAHPSLGTQYWFSDSGGSEMTTDGALLPMLRFQRLEGNGRQGLGGEWGALGS